MNTLNTSIIRQICWTNTFSSFFVIHVSWGTILALSQIKVPVIWIVARNAFSILFKRSFAWAYAHRLRLTENVWGWAKKALSFGFAPISWSLAWNTLIQWKWFVWFICWTYTFFLVIVVFKSFRTWNTRFLLNVPEVWWIATNTFWTNEISIFGANTSCSRRLENKSRRTAFTGFADYI